MLLSVAALLLLSFSSHLKTSLLEGGLTAYSQLLKPNTGDGLAGECLTVGPE